MWPRVRCGSKPAASIWILSTTVWQRTISRAWLWSSVWAGHELDLTSQRAMRWGWADSGPAAQSTLHPPEAAHPGPECISQSTDRRHSPERAVLKMSEDKTLSFLASVTISILHTSRWPSLRDAAAWWIGLHLHNVSTSFHMRPPCKWRTIKLFKASLTRCFFCFLELSTQKVMVEKSIPGEKPIQATTVRANNKCFCKNTGRRKKLWLLHSKVSPERSGA